MTAINFVRGADGAHIISDGAFVDDAGILRFIASKVLTMPHLCAAVAVRGQSNLLPLLWLQLGRIAATFDDLVPLFAGQCRKTYTEMETAVGSVQGRVEITLAGWSHSRNRAAGYLVASHSTPQARADGWPDAWTLHDMGEGCLMPMPGAAELAAAGFALPDPKDFDPMSHGLRFLDAQRLLKLPFDAAKPDGPCGCTIGGFKQITSISKFATQSSVIQRWPDEIGKPIRV